MSAESPRFSVIIPVYNRAHAIDATLQSVKNQTFPDFECIIVDDGSSDGADLEERIADLADGRFRYIRQDNKGGGAARNAGIRAARGASIAFLDSDDLFLPDKLAGDRDALEGAGPECVVFSQILADRGARQLVKPARGPARGEDISEYLTCGRGFTPTSTLAMSADLARKVLFAEGLPFGQDTDFAIRLQAAGACFRMRPVVGAIVDDRIDAGRVSQQRRYPAVMQWLEDIRPLVTERAYHAYRGWHIARLAASSDKMLALRLYFDALRRGAFPMALAALALGQILLPRHVYRSLDIRAAKAVSGHAVEEKRSVRPR